MAVCQGSHRGKTSVTCSTYHTSLIKTMSSYVAELPLSRLKHQGPGAAATFSPLKLLHINYSQWKAELYPPPLAQLQQIWICGGNIFHRSVHRLPSGALVPRYNEVHNLITYTHKVQFHRQISGVEDNQRSYKPILLLILFELITPVLQGNSVNH